MRAKPTVSLSIRVSPEVRDAAEQAAEAKRQSLKDFVEEAVTEATKPLKPPPNATRPRIRGGAEACREADQSTFHGKHQYEQHD